MDEFITYLKNTFFIKPANILLKDNEQEVLLFKNFFRRAIYEYHIIDTLTFLLSIDNIEKKDIEKVLKIIYFLNYVNTEILAVPNQEILEKQNSEFHTESIKNSSAIFLIIINMKISGTIQCIIKDLITVLDFIIYKKTDFLSLNNKYNYLCLLAHNFNIVNSQLLEFKAISVAENIMKENLKPEMNNNGTIRLKVVSRTDSQENTTIQMNNNGSVRDSRPKVDSTLDSQHKKEKYIKLKTVLKEEFLPQTSNNTPSPFNFGNLENINSEMEQNIVLSTMLKENTINILDFLLNKIKQINDFNHFKIKPVYCNVDNLGNITKFNIDNYKDNDKNGLLYFEITFKDISYITMFKKSFLFDSEISIFNKYNKLDNILYKRPEQLNSDKELNELKNKIFSSEIVLPYIIKYIKDQIKKENFEIKINTIITNYNKACTQIYETKNSKSINLIEILGKTIVGLIILSGILYMSYSYYTGIQTETVNIDDALTNNFTKPQKEYINGLIDNINVSNNDVESNYYSVHKLLNGIKQMYKVKDKMFIADLAYSYITSFSNPHYATVILPNIIKSIWNNFVSGEIVTAYFYYQIIILTVAFTPFTFSTCFAIYGSMALGYAALKYFGNVPIQNMINEIRNIKNNTIVHFIEFMANSLQIIDYWLIYDYKALISTSDIKKITNYKQLSYNILQNSEETVYLANFPNSNNITDFMLKEYALDFFRYVILIDSKIDSAITIDTIEKNENMSLEYKIYLKQVITSVSEFQGNSFTLNINDEYNKENTIPIEYLSNNSTFFKKLFRSIYFGRLHKFANKYSKNSIKNLDDLIKQKCKEETFKLYTIFFERYRNDFLNNGEVKSRYIMYEIVYKIINKLNIVFKNVLSLDYNTLFGEKPVIIDDNNFYDIKWANKSEEITSQIIEQNFSDYKIPEPLDTKSKNQINQIFNIYSNAVNNTFNPKDILIYNFKNMIFNCIDKYYDLLYLDKSKYKIPYTVDKDVTLDVLIQHFKKCISVLFFIYDSQKNTLISLPDIYTEVVNKDIQKLDKLINDIHGFFGLTDIISIKYEENEEITQEIQKFISNKFDIRNYINRLPLCIIYMLMVCKLTNMDIINVTKYKIDNHIISLIENELNVLNAVSEKGYTTNPSLLSLIEVISIMDYTLKKKQTDLCNNFIIHENYFNKLSYNPYLFGKPSNITSYNDLYFYSLNPDFIFGKTELYYKTKKAKTDTRMSYISIFDIENFINEICNNEIYEITDNIKYDVIGQNINKLYLFDSKEETHRDCILGDGSAIKYSVLFASIEKNISSFTVNSSKKYWYYYDRNKNKIILSTNGKVEECQHLISNFSPSPKYIISVTDIENFIQNLTLILSKIDNRLLKNLKLDDVFQNLQKLNKKYQTYIDESLKKEPKILQIQNYLDKPINLLYNPFNKQKIDTDKKSLSYNQLGSYYKYGTNKFTLNTQKTNNIIPKYSLFINETLDTELGQTEKIHSQVELKQKLSFDITDKYNEYEELVKNSVTNTTSDKEYSYNSGISESFGDFAQILYKSVIEGVQDTLPFDLTKINYINKKDLLSSELFITKYMELCGNKHTEFLITGQSMGGGYTEALYYILWFNCVKALGDSDISESLKQIFTKTDKPIGTKVFPDKCTDIKPTDFCKTITEICNKDCKNKKSKAKISLTKQIELLDLPVQLKIIKLFENNGYDTSYFKLDKVVPVELEEKDEEQDEEQDDPEEEQSDNIIYKLKNLLKTDIEDENILKRVMISIELILLLKTTSYVSWASPKIGTITTPFTISFLRKIIESNNEKKTNILNIGCSLDPIYRIPLGFYHIGDICYIHKNMYDQIRGSYLTILNEANKKIVNPSEPNFKTFQIIPEYERMLASTIVAARATDDEFINDYPNFNFLYGLQHYNTDEIFEYYIGPTNTTNIEFKYTNKQYIVSVIDKFIDWSTSHDFFNDYYSERYQTGDKTYKQRGSSYEEKYKYFKNLDFTSPGIGIHNSYNYIYMMSSMKHINEPLNLLPELLYQTSQIIDSRNNNLDCTNNSQNEEEDDELLQTNFNLYPAAHGGGKVHTITDLPKTEVYTLVLKIRTLQEKLNQEQEDLKQEQEKLKQDSNNDSNSNYNTSSSDNNHSNTISNKSSNNSISLTQQIYQSKLKIKKLKEKLKQYLRKDLKQKLSKQLTQTLKDKLQQKLKIKYSKAVTPKEIKESDTHFQILEQKLKKKLEKELEEQLEIQLEEELKKELGQSKSKSMDTLNNIEYLYKTKLNYHAILQSLDECFYYNQPNMKTISEENSKRINTLFYINQKGIDYLNGELKTKDC
jgi:hypothetical protein